LAVYTWYRPPPLASRGKKARVQRNIAFTRVSIVMSTHKMLIAYKKRLGRYAAVSKEHHYTWNTLQRFS
jgi:hypothetical protein